MRIKIEFTSEVEDEIRNLAKEGKTILEIKDMLKTKHDFIIGKSTLHRHIQELGLDISGNRIRKSSINEEELINYKIDGLTNEKIAEKLGISLSQLMEYEVRNDIAKKSEKKKFQLKSWIGTDQVIDLRMIKDEEIDKISKLLNYEIKKNAIIEIDGKKFIVDFYSEECDLVFLFNGIGKCDLRTHCIPAREQWEWKKKISEASLLQFAPYYFKDIETVANNINRILSEPDNFDLTTELATQHNEYFEYEQNYKPYEPSFEIKKIKDKMKTDIKFNRIENFKIENRPYDYEGLRLMDFNLIPNVNPKTGEILTDKQKDSIINNLRKQMNDRYEFWLEQSKRDDKIKLFGSKDEWNYCCCRKLYWEVIKTDRNIYNV